MEDPVPTPLNAVLTESRGYAAYLRVLRAINAALIFFGLRGRQKFWGIVYDSVSKKPLDPVVVKLVYADGESVAESQVTDMQGRYGFLARPGKFKILTTRGGYRFPSRFVRGDDDGMYKDLYHGEFFELRGDEAVVAPNIPLDPVGQDWNQQAKTPYIEFHYYRDLLFRRVTGTVFWFALLYCLIFFAFNALHRRFLSGWTYSLAPFGVLFALAKLVPEVRLWGRLKIGTVARGKGFVLELQNPRLPGISLGRAPVWPDGKFFLRANPGRYTLNLKRLEDDGSATSLADCQVSVSTEVIINGNFLFSVH